MEFFRTGEALIRSTQSFGLQFLAPTAYRTPRIGAISRRHTPQQWQCQSSHRALSSSHGHRQQANTATQIDQLVGSMQPQQRQERQEEPVSELLNRALDLDKGVPTAPTGRTSRYASNNVQRGRNPINDPRMSRSGLNSVDEVLAGMQTSSRQRPTPPAESTAFSALDIDNIFKLSDEYDLGTAPMAKAPVSTNDPAPIKLNSTTGRVIHVSSERGIDAARAFRMLGMRLAQNNVRKDAQRQRFHERPGLKRKRLKSERWRKRFKEAFQGTVARVVNMKRQGW